MTATEFNDAQHYGFFITGPTLTSESGKYLRMSELVLSALRAQGVFDNLSDGTTAPSTDMLWLDKNTDPAVLKEYDPIGSTWEPMTFDRLFGRAVTTQLTLTGGTANALVVSQPATFISERLYAVTPTANNTGATTIQVAGVGTYNVVYHDGSALDADEFANGENKLLLFTSNRFEVVVPTAGITSATATAVEAANDATGAAASVVPKEFRYRADLTAATVSASLEHVLVNEYEDGAGNYSRGRFTRSSGTPSHPWSETSNGGTVYWVIDGDTVTPQQAGLDGTDDLDATRTAAIAAGYSRLWLSGDTNWYTTTTNWNHELLTIEGPGATRIVEYFREVSTGEPHKALMRIANAQRRFNDVETAMQGLGVGIRQTTVRRTTNFNVPDDSATDIVMDDDFMDGMGGLKAAAASGVTVPPGCTYGLVIASVSFQANATNDRQIQVYGTTSNLIKTRSAAPPGGGSPADVNLIWPTPVTSGEVLYLKAYQNSGTNPLVLTDASLTFIPWYEPQRAVSYLKTFKIFQGNFDTMVSALGGFAATAAAMASHRAVAISHMDAMNGDPLYYPNAPKPQWIDCEGAYANSTSVTAGDRYEDVPSETVYEANSGFTTEATGTFADERAAFPARWTAIADEKISTSSYVRMRELIRAAKAINPNLLVFVYISMACEARYWDDAGNPQSQLTDGAAGSYENTAFYIARAQSDLAADFDGWFIDHANGTFVTSTVRDQFMALLRATGKRTMWNLTAMSAAAASFMGECPYVKDGDFGAVEGFYMDNGGPLSGSDFDDTTALSLTNTFIAAWDKYFAHRNVFAALVIENASGSEPLDYDPATMNVGTNSIAVLANAKSLFETYFTKPDDLLDYNTKSYAEPFGEKIVGMI